MRSKFLATDHHASFMRRDPMSVPDPVRPELKSLNHRMLHHAVPSQETIQ